MNKYTKKNFEKIYKLAVFATIAKEFPIHLKSPDGRLLSPIRAFMVSQKNKVLYFVPGWFIAGTVSKFFLNTQKLIIFCNPVTAAGCSGFDLPGIHSHCQIC